MKNKINSLIKRVALVVSSLLFALVPIASVQADGFALTVAPMNQKIVVNPGETYEGSFKISNPVDSTEDSYYELSLEPFYISDDDKILFEDYNGSGEIINWITFEVPTEGKLEPNETSDVRYKIDVPNDVPAGGQYASIIATVRSESEINKSNDSRDDDSNKTSALIEETKRVAHLLYVEIAGHTIKEGKVEDINVPSFMFSGNITGSSTIKNEGNVHGTAYYKMQIYPLFSSEEVFTNEEEPEERTIMPDRSLYHETTWDKTPGIGIFNVVYTVEFEGTTAQVSKMVIICPIWLLFIILAVIFGIIIWIIMRIRSKGKKKTSKPATTVESAA